MFSKTIYDTIVRALEDKPLCNISREELEHMAGYSKRHLDRIFLKHSGLTCSKYIDLTRMYKIAMEVKFTTISLEEICEKIEIKDTRNFIKRFSSIVGASPNEFKEKKEIKINAPCDFFVEKKYESCSYVSLFNFHINTKGVRYIKRKSIRNLFSSHYNEKRKKIDALCENQNINITDILVLSKFSAYSKEKYSFELMLCPQVENFNFPDKSDIDYVHINGDYLKFVWVGVEEDTFCRVKNIYDNLFLKYGVVRANGYDIESRRCFIGVNRHYVFSYYVPIVLDISVTDILTNYQR